MTRARLESYGWGLPDNRVDGDMRSLRFLIPVMAVVLSGCHYYAPAEPSALGPQERIRVQVNPNEAANLMAFVDARSMTVSGQFISQSADSVRMVVRTPLAFAPVSIPRTSIVSLERRSVDNKKSFIFSAAAVATIGVLAYKGFEGNNNNIPGGDGDGGDATVIPLFSWVLGLPFGLGR